MSWGLSTTIFGASTEASFVLIEWRRAGGKKIRGNEPVDHALGRSQGGYGTKVHLVVDGQGTPLAAHITPGQVHELKVANEVIDPENVPLRYLTDPKALAGDKGYSSKAFRAQVEAEGIAPIVPLKSNEKPISDEPFPKDLYRRRNVIERCVGWLKECRRIATRFEKLAVSFQAMLDLAFLRQYLKLLPLA